jgi:hypothetical protein
MFVSGVHASSFFVKLYGAKSKKNDDKGERKSFKKSSHEIGNDAG